MMFLENKNRIPRLVCLVIEFVDNFDKWFKDFEGFVSFVK